MDVDKLNEALGDRKWSKLKPAQKFAAAWNAWGYEQEPTLEHEFDDARKWRFDFCWPSIMVAVEINGFGFGHQMQIGVAQDAEKARAATLQGWSVLVFTTRCISSRQSAYDAVEQVCMLLSKRHGLVDWRE